MNLLQQFPFATIPLVLLQIPGIRTRRNAKKHHEWKSPESMLLLQWNLLWILWIRDSFQILVRMELLEFCHGFGSLFKPMLDALKKCKFRENYTVQNHKFHYQILKSENVKYIGRFLRNERKISIHFSTNVTNGKITWTHLPALNRKRCWIPMFVSFEIEMRGQNCMEDPMPIIECHASHKSGNPRYDHKPRRQARNYKSNSWESL